METATELASHLSSLTSLSFDFTQQTSGQMSGRPRRASGTAYFAKVDGEAKMRWNYLAPDTQVIISDGKTLKMYFKNLNQMIIAPAQTLQKDVTYTFFTGEGNLEEDFIIESEADLPGGDEKSPPEFEVLTLIPRDNTTQVREIRLWVHSETTIKRIEIRDAFDTLTLLLLRNIEENELISDGELLIPDFFEFEPPKGTEIIYQ